MPFCLRLLPGLNSLPELLAPPVIQVIVKCKCGFVRDVVLEGWILLYAGFSPLLIDIRMNAGNRDAGTDGPRDIFMRCAHFRFAKIRVAQLSDEFLSLGETCGVSAVRLSRRMCWAASCALMYSASWARNGFPLPVG